MDELEMFISSGGATTKERRSDPLAGRPQAEQDAIRRVMEASAAGRGASVTVPQVPAPIPTNAVVVRDQSSAVAQPAPDDLEEFIKSGGAQFSRQGSELPKPAWPTGLVEQIPGMKSQETKPQEPTVRSRFDQLVRGPAEAALALGTGFAAAPIAQVGGMIEAGKAGKYRGDESVQVVEKRAKEILDSLVYRPRTEAAQKYVSAIVKALDASKLQGLGPSEMIALSNVAAGVRQAGKVNRTLREVGLGEVPDAGPSGESAFGVLPSKAIGPSGERGGVTPPVASTAPAASTAQFGNVDAQGASRLEQARAMAASTPELMPVVEKAGENVNLEVLARHVEALSLPYPVYLTRGQATKDTGILSNEWNRRAEHAPYRERFQEQNQALINSTNAMREAVAPDVFVRKPHEVGEIPLKTYEAKAAALQEDIKAKYAALEAANGGRFPLDLDMFLMATKKALGDKLKTQWVSPQLKGTLRDIAKKGEMTFEDFETLRTMTATEQRSATNGNFAQAAAIIREQLERLPMPKGAEHLKPLADAARSANKHYNDLLRADKAFKAVVDEKASPDTFLAKYMLSAPVNDVRRMMAGLSHDETAVQSMRAAIVDRLKESAGVLTDTGNFSQANYNKALQALRPKIDLLFDPKTAKTLESIGNVARDTLEQPRGSFVNNSNTAVTVLGELADNAKKVAAASAEGALAAKGIPIRFIREGIQKRALAKEIQKSLELGAGILLRDVGR